MSREKIEVFKDETTGEWIKKDEATGKMLELTEKDKAITGMIDVLESAILPRMITNVDIAIPLCEAGYRKQSVWISVDERLPEKEGTYLTYTDKDKVDLDIFCIYPSHGTKFWSGEINGKTTHWMPLPEPPKMKGGE